MKKTPNRWLILAAAILTNLSLGVGYAWSVFQAALLQTNADLGWQLSQTSLAFSISFAMVPLGMIIFGPKVDQYGPKRFVFLGGILFGLGMFLTGFAKSIPMLYLTYGVILGLGIGAAYGAATSVGTKWFPDKKGLAGGLTAAGFGLGPVLFSPIIRTLIVNYGVYNTFKILGVVVLIVILAASTVMEKAPAPVVAPGTVVPEGKDYRQMLKETNYWILWAIYTLGATGGMMIIGTASDIATTYTLGDSVLIVMLVSIANTLGRVFWGAVSDKVGRYLTVILMLLVVSLGSFLVANNASFGAIFGVIGLMCIALSFGGFLGSFPGITAENWGVKYVGSNYGWMFTAYGVAAIFGPQIGSKIKGLSGNYGTAFFIVIGMALLGILLQLIYIKRAKK